ncbi:MAG: RNA-binding transcriptional accessory protein, partial [Lawsonibacter sp.]|nr:RNA-binding transcriptional accessory protein [Lawsonibacter sp.]
MDLIIQTLARELGRTAEHVSNVVALIDEGATIPFIARYRKELHGSMDDQLLRQLADRLQYLRSLEARKAEVKSAIEGQGKLTDELSAAIDAAAALAEVEDLYRPYKQKRRTRATVAREKGLEPLAALAFAFGPAVDMEAAAQDYIDPEKGVETAEDALRGASDIIAELISDDAGIRKELRALYLRRSLLVSKAAAKEPEDSVYRLYYDFKQPVGRVQGYQVLAINRGEREDILKVSVELDPETAHIAVRRAAVPNRAAMDFVRAAADDAYDRLIQPSLEREIRSHLTDLANEGAIHMFALNLKPLLMQPPVKGRVTMGLDPGYRMGCKVAVVDGTGKVLDTAVVYPTHGARQKQACIAKLSALIREHGVEHIAIGNGTASRETEQMTVELIKGLGGGVSYMIVSEAGASVYSASKLAAEEFPQFDVNLRSAVSIARRLQDPLAELVKIDPKAIGV